MDEEEAALAALRRRAAISQVITALVILISAADLVTMSANIYGWSDFWAMQVDGGYLVDQLFLSAAIVLIVSYILNCFWIHQAHKIMWERSNEGMETSPGMAIAWYAIPIANLFKPFQAMRELFRMSHQQDESDAPPLLWAWWITWLLSGFLSFGLRTAYTPFDLASSLLTIVSAVCLILIIRSVTKAQHEIPLAGVFD